MESRRLYLAKAKQALARLEAAGVAGAARTTGAGATELVLRRGSKGEAVAALQTKLQAAGYPLAVDGDFGAATELAVTHFQRDRNLTADGIAGPKTLAALEQKPT